MLLLNKKFLIIILFLFTLIFAGTLYNLQDFKVQAQIINTDAPASFDWRNVHGINWVSPVRNYPNNHGCFADASTALLETQINLYYNQLFDLDLSEQAARDCYYDTANTIPALTNKYNPDINCPTNGSEESWFARKIVNVGIFDETCDIFRLGHTLNSCSSEYICSDWQNRVWKANDYKELYTAATTDWFDYRQGYNDLYGTVTQQQCPNMLSHVQYLASEAEFKKELIKKGPMHSIVQEWGHEMLLVGYDTKKDWTLLANCDDNTHDGYCFSDGCIKPLGNCDATRIGKRYCDNKNLLECAESNGIYFFQGTGLSCNMPPCSSGELGNSQCINDGIYVCTDDGISPYWNKTSACDGSCVNGQCVNTQTQFQPGDKRCIRNGGDQHFAYENYTPGSKATTWIFKNQNLGGAVFGDQGFINVSMPYADLVSGTYYTGPFTPPTNSSYIPNNFDGIIRCVDLDSDGFCNWGISETKPSSCSSSCNIKKDCDDSNQDLNFYDENMNCVSNIDLSISANAVQVIGSTYDLNFSINNTGGNPAKNVVLKFMKSYDLFVSSSGVTCTVNEAEYQVSCSISSIASNSTITGSVRMTSLDPNSTYELIVSSTSQVDPDLTNNSVIISISNPVQQCTVNFNNNIYTQNCIDIDNNGTYYTTQGDLIRIVCMTPANPLATDCTYFFQITNVQPDLKIIDTDSGNGMLWGQGGSNNPHPKLTILSANNTVIGEVQIMLDKNLSWENVTAATDTAINKAYIHNLIGLPGTETSYSLYIPYGYGDQSVGICPGADSLAMTGPECANFIVKRETDTDTDIVTINNKQYWKVSGLTSTGGYSIQGNILTRTGNDITLFLLAGMLFINIVNLGNIFTKRKLRFNND
ncbi:MAG: hypothetical protein WCJ58_08245 [bacterium]